MVHFITPHYQRRSFFRPKRPARPWRATWRALRRYQVLELLVLIAIITGVWLGARIDNNRTAWDQLEPAGLEANADLTTGVPAFAPPAQREPL